MKQCLNVLAILSVILSSSLQVRAQQVGVTGSSAVALPGAEPPDVPPNSVMVVTASARMAVKPEPRAWIGIGTGELTKEAQGKRTGLVVQQVADDGPAAKAGVKAGDILLKLDDQLLLNTEQFHQLVQVRKEGDVVTLTGARQGKAIKFEVKLVTKEILVEEMPPPVAGNVPVEVPADVPVEIRNAMEKQGIKVIVVPPQPPAPHP